MRITCLAAALALLSAVCSAQTNTVTATNTPSLSDVLLANTNEMVTISIDTNEVLRVEGRVTQMGEIRQLTASAGLTNTTPVWIEAAATVRHGTVCRVMDALAEQKFMKLNFRQTDATAQPQPKGTPQGSPPAVALTHLRPQVEKLIRALGADKYAQRKQARTDLRAMGKPILPLLKARTDDEDPEVRLALQEIIEDIQPGETGKGKDADDSGLTEEERFLHSIGILPPSKLRQ